MYKQFGKDRTWFETDTDRQTDKHTQMHSLQYFAITPVAEVSITLHRSTSIKNWEAKFLCLL